MEREELPQLRLRLPGTWFEIDVSSDAAAVRSARAMAAALLGKREDAAPARIRIQEQVRRAIEGGRAAALRALFIASEVAPGLRLPISLTIYEPEDLQITPAAGSSPAAVASALRAVLVRLGIPGALNAVELDCREFRAVRTLGAVRLDAEGQAGAAFVPAPQTDAGGLRAAYWCSVPGTKQVVVTVLATPLADVPAAMLRFFDAIVTGARFARPDPVA